MDRRSSPIISQTPRVRKSPNCLRVDHTMRQHARTYARSAERPFHTTFPCRSPPASCSGLMFTFTSSSAADRRRRAGGASREAGIWGFGEGYRYCRPRCASRRGPHRRGDAFTRNAPASENDLHAGDTWRPHALPGMHRPRSPRRVSPRGRARQS
jgi:hypothetical protein